MTFYVDFEQDLINYKNKEGEWKNDDYKIVVKTTNKLIFKINDVLVHTITQDGGTTINVSNLPEPILQDGDVFSGWDKEIPLTMPSENIDVYGYVSRIAGVSVGKATERKNKPRPNGKGSYRAGRVLEKGLLAQMKERVTVCTVHKT